MAKQESSILINGLCVCYQSIEMLYATIDEVTAGFHVSNILFLTTCKAIFYWL